MGVNAWSREPDDNGLADPLIDARDTAAARVYARGQRAVMAAVKRFADDQGGALVSTGSGNVYVLNTYSGLAPDTIQPGVSFAFVPDRDNTGPSSLVIDGHGALPLRSRDGLQLGPGHLRAGRLVRVVYDDTSSSWRTVDIGSIGNADFADAPALTIKGNAGDGLTDLPVSDARDLLNLDRVANKSESDLVASGPIAEALAGKATDDDVAAAVAPIPGLIQTARNAAIATVVGGAPRSADTLGKVNTLLVDKASVAQTTSLQSALIIVATSFVDGCARQVRSYTGQ